MLYDFEAEFHNLERRALELGVLLRVSTTFVVAVSGGIDSVTALHFLAWLQQKYPINVVVAHVNHGLRVEAKNDSDFVSKLAKSYGFPYYEKTIAVSEVAQARGMGIEEAGRYVRKCFWQELCQELFATNESISEAAESLLAPATLPVVVEGHQQNDVAETVLLNILRGTGLDGLCSLSEWQLIVDAQKQQSHYLWRPLLSLSRQRICDLAEHCGLVWCEDQSNYETIYTRNILRNELLPKLEEKFPQTRSQLAKLSQSLQAEREILEQMAQNLLDQIRIKEINCDRINLKKSVISRQQLKKQATGLRKRIIKLWLLQFGVTDINAEQLNKLDMLCTGTTHHASVHLAHGYIVKLDLKNLYVSQEQAEGDS